MAETTKQYRNRINQLKTGIENEPYIKEMRENIAEGISTTGNRQADIEEQFQEVIDNTTGKDVISAPELIAARNGEANLKTRLDKEQQQVNAQLAQKASINYVDAILMDIAKGGPKGPFNSIDVLNATYPTGADGTWLVFDNSFTDGAHSFIWDSTNYYWKDLGVYQATGIGEGAIKQKHLAFTVPEGHVGKNKYNMNSDKIVTGVFVNKINGQLYANLEYEVYTMPVIGGEKIVINWLDQTAFYDVNGVYISGGGEVYSRGAGALDVPANAVTVKTSVFIPKRSVFQIEYAAAVTSYEDYKIVLNDNAVPEKRVLDIVRENLHSSKTSISTIMARIMSGVPLTIKLIGDSITNGVGGTGYDTSGAQIAQGRYINVNGYCWANELRDYIQEKFPNVTVLNYGISGITADFIDRNKSTLITSSDDIVIVMLGTNNRGNENTEYLYTSLINVGTYIKSFGNEVIFMSNIPASVSNESDKIYHMEDVDNTVSRVANQFNQEYISLYKEFIKYCDYKSIEIDSLLGDGLHPNDDGYEVMYKIASSELGIGIKRPNATW